MKHLFWHKTLVKQEERERLKKQKACILWFTGLSASGKSTLANLLEKKLIERKIHTFLLDGDNTRYGLNSDLGFDEASRHENIRRIAEVARLFVSSGLITIVATISPFSSDRNFARNLVQNGEFIEIFVNTPLEICQRRDPKGLYQKAQNGEIKNFTGIDSPYEIPLNAEIVIHHNSTPQNQIDQIIEFLEKGRYLG